MPFPGETWLNPYLGTAVLCCLVVTIWLLRWKRRAVLWKQVEEARRKREQRLERMQKAALTFREQVGAPSRAAMNPPRRDHRLPSTLHPLPMGWR